MILVDSSVWIDYFRGVSTRQTDRLDMLLGTDHLAIGDIILTEVLQGFPRQRDFDLALEHLSALTLVEIGGRDVAVRAAENFRRLRAQGVTPRRRSTPSSPRVASRAAIRCCSATAISSLSSNAWD